MGATHNDATKIAHATETKSQLKANGSPILQVVDDEDTLLLEIDPITLTVLGDGSLEDWQFKISGTPLIKGAVANGEAAFVKLCDGNGDMVVQVPAAGLVTPLDMESGKNVQVTDVIYSAA